VLQDKKTASVTDERLLEIGLSNRSNSIFERLYHRAEKNNWNWAFATLSAQGRMHQDICEFPNKYFYDGNLNLLPEESNEKWQSEPLNYKIPESNTLLTDKLLSNRVVFIPSYSDLDSNPKTNLSEAVKVAELVDNFNRIYKSNNLHFGNETIGVITPFRAQIAQIRQELAKFENAYDQITIDTVERYQGAARDIIIVSLCLNMEHQLGSLISVSDDEKVDRKLNVALTRARKHLVIIGNESIMKKNKHYSMLLEWISENNGIL
jgi:DNA replication ATP-dependent helicase Dna2